MGLTKAISLDGGIGAWRQAGFPIELDDARVAKGPVAEAAASRYEFMFVTNGGDERWGEFPGTRIEFNGATRRPRYRL